jgi:hypothetical protein
VNRLLVKDVAAMNIQLPYLKSGSVTVGKRKVVGQILITDRAILLFSDSSGAMTAGLLGGLLGYFIGRAVSRHQAKKSPPGHMTDPDILSLEEKLRSKLLTSALEARFPFDSSVAVEETRGGFRFRSGENVAEFGNWPNKKDMLQLFQEKNLTVKRR